MSTASRETEELLQIIDDLRTHCAWTRELSHESLRQYLVEESYEVIDAIAQGDPAALREELGDLLLQIVLHARIAEETGGFDFAQVVRGLSQKMRRRNRHIFDERGKLRATITQDVQEIVRIWDAAKAAEKPQERPHQGLPAGLPALSMSQKLLSRQRRGGHLSDSNPWRAGADLAQIGDEDSLAQALLALTGRADELGLDAESVLRDALLERYAPPHDETSSPEAPEKR